ncbi:MAG TPA: hypothetical protein VH650_09670 [Gaiellaceae bacterium]|jgi:hypothetical protein
MRLGRTLLALALAAGIGLTLVTPASAHSRARLLERFQPVLFFHADEAFRPIRVETFVDDSNLEAATSQTTWVVVDPDPGADSLPTTSPPVWRLNQRECFAGAPLGDLPCYVAAAGEHSRSTVYGRVTHEGDATVLQYWLFYYDDLYSYPFLPPGAIWQSHEGDWEVVNVVLSHHKKPLAVGYSQHCSGEVRSWDDTSRWKGHPKVFVAVGSHANYFEPGVHPFDPACLPADVIAFFQQAGLPLPADVVTAGAADGARIARLSKRHPPEWLAFPGYWGELQYFHAPPPVGTVAFGTSPQGPAFHAVWSQPLATLATWH